MAKERRTRLRTVFGFAAWLLPEGGRSPRLYFSLLKTLLCGRQSVYRHFKLLKAAHGRIRLRTFVRALASVRAHDPTLDSTPARLLARLLRTTYLTEVLPRREEAAHRAGPNRGYINHPQFGYGESLGSATRPRTTDGNLG